MVPEGYRYSFVQNTNWKEIYIIFQNYDNNKSRYFALDNKGKPANGILSYGIPEGALITITFLDGYQVGDVIVDD